MEVKLKRLVGVRSKEEYFVLTILISLHKQKTEKNCYVLSIGRMPWKEYWILAILTLILSLFHFLKIKLAHCDTFTYFGEINLFCMIDFWSKIKKNWPSKFWPGYFGKCSQLFKKYLRPGWIKYERMNCI